ncbi:MAG: hypothetical protein Q4E45_11635, partial [Eubacteriales bacterium]|nr:hypothetical protein [Eubacteriales bacterium]
IDTAIPSSPITLTVTPKNFNAGSGESYSVRVMQLNTKTKTETEVTELLDIDVMGNVITLTEKTPGSLASGYTYNAYTKADVGGTETPAVKTKLTVKWSQPAKVPASVTLKATGAIDVIRPGSVVTVTPTVKNCFTYVPAVSDLHIYKQEGKNFVDVTNTAENPFAVRVENGAFVLRPTVSLNHKTDKFRVSLKTTMDGRQVMSPQVAVTVKMGTSKIAQDVKAVTLLKDDRYDRAVLRLTPEAGLSGIKRVSLVSPADKNKRTVFALTPLGNNEYAIGYNGNKLPDPGFKGGAVKLQVFLDGNLTTAPNATLSVSVKLN